MFRRLEFQEQLMAQIEKTVFISYRRKDMPWALAVYQNLTVRGYDVFFDYESISSGDFEQIILSNIKARAHFLVILTPSALERCSQPGDWLRREIETAISEKRNIVPLFFDGFEFGDSSVSAKLTGELATLKKYNGLKVPRGFFNEAMERLHDKYLNVALEAVLHPVSDEVQKVVKEHQNAANRIIVQEQGEKGKAIMLTRSKKKVEEELRGQIIRGNMLLEEVHRSPPSSRNDLDTFSRNWHTWRVFSEQIMRESFSSLEPLERIKALTPRHLDFGQSWQKRAENLPKDIEKELAYLGNLLIRLDNYQEPPENT
jgi:hypothetical protein